METIFHINGMHCKSCEILLEQEIKKIAGVTHVFASHKSGTIKIESSHPLSEERVINAVEKYDYKVVAEQEKKKSLVSHKNTLEDYGVIIILFIGISVFALIMSNLDISKTLPSVGNDVGIAVAMLMGIVASVSTCLALVGGIVMSFGGMYPVREDHKHPLLAKATPHIYFHIGRIVGFTLLGGILGLIGSKINYSPSVTGLLTVIVAIVMFYIGLQILNIVPNITRLGFHLPKSFSAKIHKLQNSNNYFAPILIGILTFFVPCGFTQSMQLVAMTSQNFWSGALIMGAFALGTMPVLLSLGLGSTYAQKNPASLFHKIIGIIIVVFAFSSLNSGLSLAGYNINFNPFNKTDVAQDSVYSDGVQIVKMDVDYGFSPNSFTVKKGVPVRWEINGINISGCVNSVVMPKLGINKILNTGLNVITFTPKETGTLGFSCGMGMVRGQFNVIN